MNSYSKKPENLQFGKDFWKGFALALFGAAIIAISLVCMALIAFYGKKYNW